MQELTKKKEKREAANLARASRLPSTTTSTTAGIHVDVPVAKQGVTKLVTKCEMEEELEAMFAAASVQPKTGTLSSDELADALWRSGICTLPRDRKHH